MSKHKYPYLYVVNTLNPHDCIGVFMSMEEVFGGIYSYMEKYYYKKIHQKNYNESQLVYFMRLKIECDNIIIFKSTIEKRFQDSKIVTIKLEDWESYVLSIPRRNSLKKLIGDDNKI